MSPESQLIHHYQFHSSIRDPRLFSDFLIPGYKITTTNSVSQALDKKVQMAKLNLGMFITLIDDLADHPTYFNPKLLQHMYLLFPGGSNLTIPHLSKSDRATYELGRKLMENIHSQIKDLPHYQSLKEILHFDLETIYRANRYSELMHLHPQMINLKESQEYGPYNMGMLAAGMIDLMGSELFVANELGLAREVFLLGQRMGRIGNLLATHHREIAEKDVTNEISVAGNLQYRENLRVEFLKLKNEIESRPILTFDSREYAKGMDKLFDLHLSLMGVI